MHLIEPPFHLNPNVLPVFIPSAGVVCESLAWYTALRRIVTELKKANSVTLLCMSKAQRMQWMRVNRPSGTVVVPKVSRQQPYLPEHLAYTTGLQVVSANNIVPKRLTADILLDEFGVISVAAVLATLCCLPSASNLVLDVPTSGSVWSSLVANTPETLAGRPLVVVCAEDAQSLPVRVVSSVSEIGKHVAFLVPSMASMFITLRRLLTVNGWQTTLFAVKCEDRMRSYGIAVRHMYLLTVDGASVRLMDRDNGNTCVIPTNIILCYMHSFLFFDFIVAMSDMLVPTTALAVFSEHGNCVEVVVDYAMEEVCVVGAWKSTQMFVPGQVPTDNEIDLKVGSLLSFV